MRIHGSVWLWPPLSLLRIQLFFFPYHSVLASFWLRPLPTRAFNGSRTIQAVCTVGLLADTVGSINIRHSGWATSFLCSNGRIVSGSNCRRYHSFYEKARTIIFFTSSSLHSLAWNFSLLYPCSWSRKMSRWNGRNFLKRPQSMELFNKDHISSSPYI